MRPVQITSNLKNTITGPKAIIGKKFHSEDIQAEIPLVAYEMIDSAGDVGIPVRSTAHDCAAPTRVVSAPTGATPQPCALLTRRSCTTTSGSSSRPSGP